MLLRLTLILILAQVLFAYFQSDIFSNNSALITFLKTKAVQSSAVTWGWAGLISIQLLLYSLFVLILWWLTRATALFLKLRWEATRLLGLIIFIFAVVFIFFANQFYFPNSLFAFLPYELGAKYIPFNSGNIYHTFLFISGGMLSIVALMAIIGTILWIFKHPVVIAGALVIFITISAYNFYYLDKQPQPRKTAIKKTDKPNIIIIGIDSLRPSALTYFGAKKSYTPTIDKFLKSSTVFTHSLTPLARTSPAWGSILTGDYPKKLNFRYNLTNPAELTLRETLPNILKKQGYYTLYSTDDRTFNQINYQFGFDKIIAPEMGFNNLLFSQINDFPLSNLIMNLPLSHYLFPFNYANRATIPTYRPDTYNNALKKVIKNTPENKPLLLSVNFTIAHWPYYYANLVETKNNHDNNLNEQLYYQTLPIADAQFSALMKTLKAQGLLDNAFVILLSNHGDAFGKPGDRVTQPQNFIPKQATPPAVFYTDKFAHGYGTDVLSLTQYHTVLAAQYFNGKKQFVGNKNSVVSLIDVTPTILDFLNIKSKYDRQGESLLPLINTRREFNLPRSIFIESGFNSPPVLSAIPKVNEVLRQGLKYYQILPDSGYLIIKPSYTNKIIASKNRAIISSPWMLAFYPHAKRPGTLVLVNLVTKQWTTDMQSDFARQSPLIALATRLKRFYGNEINMPDLSL